MSNKLKASVLLAAAVILAGGFFVLKRQETVKPLPVPPAPAVTVVDEHLTIDETLRDVNFCGKTYKVKQILIDGVDVVQRVAELATNDLIPETLKDGPYGPNMDEWKTLTLKKGEMARIICEGVQFNTVSGTIDIEKPNSTDNNDQALPKRTSYTVFANGFAFIVNTDTKEIYQINGYTGGVIGPIGTLK